jgi:hypothetical protein
LTFQHVTRPLPPEQCIHSFNKARKISALSRRAVRTVRLDRIYLRLSNDINLPFAKVLHGQRKLVVRDLTGRNCTTFNARLSLDGGSLRGCRPSTAWPHVFCRD